MVTTLDKLIEQYEVPSFIKIDVEGYELEVLKGLTRLVPALSFEFTVVVKEKVPKMGKKMTHPILGQNGRWIS